MHLSLSKCALYFSRQCVMGLTAWDCAHGSGIPYGSHSYYSLCNTGEGKFWYMLTLQWRICCGDCGNLAPILELHLKIWDKIVRL